MNSQKPIASLSLDLDNQWSYLKIHGDPGWESFPSYLDLAVPRILQFLSERELQITFFVVGQDAALEKNHEALRAIAAKGHEIGNHSFSHDPWLHLFSRDRILLEVQSTEARITTVTGQRPVGFRGPGFSLSVPTLQVLQQQGYLYDASTLPTFLGPLARWYYFLHSNLSKGSRNDRRLLFGSFGEGLRPLKPYRWHGASNALLEIPVTTMPFLRTPIHLSYILYLSSFSTFLALEYFRSAIALCRWMGIAPSLLLHPLDFLGRDDNVGLDFFPGMRLHSDQKLSLVSEALGIYGDQFQVVSLRAHAEHIASAPVTSVINHHAYSNLLPKSNS
jgi:peptidoglycan-N-acetylglucosamine deacetylase